VSDSRHSSSANATPCSFRAEFFNVLNHPNFNAPNFGGKWRDRHLRSGNYTNPNFGEIGSTRDASFDPRQIQFCSELYY